MEIIPAIDLIDGQCVRLTEGDYNRKSIYNNDPLAVAREFEAAGLKRLHLVDLDGAKAGAVQNWHVLESIAAGTSLTIDFGGGVKTSADVERVLASGAAYVTVGSIAVKNEQELLSWFDQFGADKFLLGADVKGENIAIHGWTETTSIDIFPFLKKYASHGVQQVFCTDVSKDGKLEGPSIELYEKIIATIPGLYFIASGGVTTLQDLDALSKIGCKAAIIGKAIYEGKITIEQLYNWQS